MVLRQFSSSKSSNCFVRTETLRSIFRIPLLSLCYSSNRIHNFRSNRKSVKEFPENQRGILLNQQVVQSTLANCPSDLVALSFFLWCARRRNYFHDRYAFTHMANVVIRLVERYESIDGVVKELERIGCVTRPQTFLHLIRILWQGGLYTLIFDAFEAMGQYGYALNTFAWNVVMDISFKTGQTDVALRVLRENHAPNFLSFNIALCNLCKSNDLFNIRVVVQNMLRAGYYPSVEAFMMILNCFSKKGRLVEAFQVLGLMVSLGYHPCLAVWNILIDGFCRLGSPDMADFMLEKMIGVGCSPNVMTYTSLVKGFMECKMLDDAFRILHMMESGGCEIDLVLSNVLIHCLSKMQRHDEALAVFYDLRKRKLEPDAYTFSSLVSALCSSGKFYLLPKLLGCFNCSADLVVFNSLLSYFCKAGFPISAVEFFYDLVDRGFMLDKYSYAGLLTGLCRAEKINEAVNVYHGMVIEGFDLDAHIHTLIISELIRARKYQRVVSLIREVVLKQYPLDSVSYAVAVQGLVKSGQVQEAFSLFNQMKELGFAPDAVTTNILLSGFCKERDLNMVKQLLREMFDLKIDLHYDSFIKIFNFVFKSRHYHSIFNLLIVMIDSGLLPERATHLLWLGGLAHGIRVEDRHYELLREYSGGNFCATTSDSEDFIEVAASVG